MSENSLKKQERLSSRKAIENLFSDGESFFIFPLKVVYQLMPLQSPFPVQAAFSVSKRNFKRAVRRNFLKRRMREAYRTNKTALYAALGDEKKLAVMFIYAGKELKEFDVIEKGMKKALVKLIELVK